MELFFITQIYWIIHYNNLVREIIIYLNVSPRWRVKVTISIDDTQVVGHNHKTMRKEPLCVLRIMSYQCLSFITSGCAQTRQRHLKTYSNIGIHQATIFYLFRHDDLEGEQRSTFALMNSLLVFFLLKTTFWTSWMFQDDFIEVWELTYRPLSFIGTHLEISQLYRRKSEIEAVIAHPQMQASVQEIYEAYVFLQLKENASEGRCKKDMHFMILNIIPNGFKNEPQMLNLQWS